MLGIYSLVDNYLGLLDNVTGMPQARGFSRRGNIPQSGKRKPLGANLGANELNGRLGISCRLRDRVCGHWQSSQRIA